MNDSKDVKFSSNSRLKAWRISVECKAQVAMYVYDFAIEVLTILDKARVES